jgi:hypothetical protein
MNWYKKAQSSSGNDSSMIQRHLSDIVEIGLSPELGRLPTVPSPWPRPGDDVKGKPGRDNERALRRKRRQEKRRRLMEGTEPASQQANLPTDAVGNAPEGTGRSM